MIASNLLILKLLIFNLRETDLILAPTSKTHARQIMLLLLIPLPEVLLIVLEILAEIIQVEVAEILGVEELPLLQTEDLLIPPPIIIHRDIKIRGLILHNQEELIPIYDVSFVVIITMFWIVLLLLNPEDNKSLMNEPIDQIPLLQHLLHPLLLLLPLCLWLPILYLHKHLLSLLITEQPLPDPIPIPMVHIFLPLMWHHMYNLFLP
jgi:hypothetical protein